VNGSRLLAIAEASLIMAPVSVLVALGASWAWRYFIDALWHLRLDLLLLVSAVCIAGLVGVVAGWCLLGRYILLGPTGLLTKARLAWLGAALGALTALTGAGLALLGQGVIFMIGLPALIPLAHLWRVRRQAARQAPD
jgi:hypothetical protein